MNEIHKVLKHLVGKKLRDSARAVEEYSAKEDLVDGAKAEVTSQQISDLSTQLISAQAEEAGIKARQTQIQSVIENKKPVDSVTEVMQSHMIELLKNDETSLVSQLAQLQSKYGDRHPKILALQAELAEVRKKQHSEIGHITQNVDNEVLAIEAKIDLLQKKLQELEDKRKRENHAAIGLKELQREADANRALYETFLTKYKETKMLGDLQQPDTKIISSARIPVKRSGTNPALIVMVISFAGFITGFFLALLLEQLETTYLHGHSVGGTNPTLVEALGAKSAIIAHNNIFNRWVADHSAIYFSNEENLKQVFDLIEKNQIDLATLSQNASEQHQKHFQWLPVLQAYEKLIESQF